MSDVLDRIRAKISRARQHLEDFRLGLDTFYATKPYAVDVKDDAEAGKRIYYVTKADPVPRQLETIAADVIQNVRSPLDQIAYQLVLAARGGREPDWPIYYPISASAMTYQATRNGRIRGVRQEVIDAIDASEPYKGGKGHALWQLNELNAPDKHKLLIGAGSISAGVDIIPTFTAVGLFAEHSDLLHKLGPVFIRPADQSPLTIGHELYVEPLDHEVQKDRRFAFEVALSVPGIVDCEPALKMLESLTTLVDATVTKFGEFLP